MYFNSSVIYSASAPNVNRNTGVISNVTLVKPGKAKGHSISLDDQFINDVVSQGNDHGPGIKARFGHPNICATALGTYLGRFKNFRKIDDAAIADMHLDKSAIKSPNGDLYGYVLDMAENNPDMFGASIAFKKGKDKSIPDPDKPGTSINFATLDTLYAADFVDSPAATDGLFELFHQDDLSSQVTIFLDDHPEIFDLIYKNPSVLDEFLSNYSSYKKLKIMNLNDAFTAFSAKIKGIFSNAGDSAISDDLVKQFNDQIDAFKTETDQRISELNSSITEHLATITALNTEVNTLKAKKSGKVSGDPALNIVVPKDTFTLSSDAPPEFKRKIKNLPKSE